MSVDVVVSIDIGGTQFGVALVRPNGVIVQRMHGATNRDEGPAWMVSQVIQAGEELLRSNQRCLCRAVGLGFGGPVDFSRQEVLASMHVRDWSGFPLVAHLEQAFSVPTIMDNDANAGCYGEYRFGAGRGYDTLLYYTVSTGIGGGIVLNGSLWRGAHCLAGEFGHIRLGDGGPRCSCGQCGCLEAYCSGTAVAREGQSLWGMPVSARDIFALAQAGDAQACSLVEQTRERLAQGIVAAINVIDPQLVVIGGGVSRSSSLFGGLPELVNQALPMPGYRQIPVVPASLKENSVILGAAALAWDVVGGDDNG